MAPSTILAILAFTLFGVCILLVMHHGYSHRWDGPHPLGGMDQYFQLSDVGNCRSCNHEMWILGLALVAGVLAAISLLV